MALHVKEVRTQFPILTRRVNGKPLCYLDNAASAQKPLAVLEALRTCFDESYANVHRGLHSLANETTAKYEAARTKTAYFLGAPTPENIVFTRNATAAFNLVAYGLMGTLKAGDEIIISQMEHHSNIVPWHFLRERLGVIIKFVAVLPDGQLDQKHYKSLFTTRTKLVSIVHMSNVLGTINPIADMVKIAHEHDCLFMADGAQACVHMPINVKDLGVDFYALTSHKLYGPTGIGALYGTTQALNALQPFEGGGEMIADVFENKITYQDAPYRFEAGTPAIMEAIGFNAALEWLSQFNPADVMAHEQALYTYTLEELRKINGFKLIGDAPQKGAVLSFTLQGIHPHDIAQILDKYGVCVRAGQHCTQPLMEAFGVHSTTRASFGIYNDFHECDQFIDALKKAIKLLM